MKEKILFVDDEENVLLSYRRNLRKDFEIETALSGQEALEKINTKGPFAVVISDMRMPGMNGIQLLAQIREIAQDTIRIILTGHSDFGSAVSAVNEGSVYRFLTKPCQPDYLKEVIGGGIKQYHILKAEHELLNKTLKGMIKVLVEMLSVNDQQSFIHVLNLRNLIRTLSEANIISSNWEIEIAALLSKIGLITLPASVISKIRNNQELSVVEQGMVDRLPQITHDLLANIPRLESVAKIVLYQNKFYDGTGFPGDEVKGADIPLGSRIIKILNDMIDLENSGQSRDNAGKILSKRSGNYDPDLLDNIVNKICNINTNYPDTVQKQISVWVKDLQVGQMLLDNVEAESGQLLVMAGQEITEPVLMRIKNWAKLYKIKEPISIAVENDEKNIHPGEEQGKAKKVLSGDLGELSIIELVQMLNLNKKSGILRIEGKNTGDIFLKNGELYGAKTEKNTGEEAIYEMVSFEDGQFNFERNEKDMIHNINSNTMNVLMGACQILDEKRYFDGGDNGN